MYLGGQTTPLRLNEKAVVHQCYALLDGFAFLISLPTTRGFVIRQFYDVKRKCREVKHYISVRLLQFSLRISTFAIV